MRKNYMPIIQLIPNNRKKDATFDDFDINYLYKKYRELNKEKYEELFSIIEVRKDKLKQKK